MIICFSTIENGKPAILATINNAPTTHITPRIGELVLLSVDSTTTRAGRVVDVAHHACNTPEPMICIHLNMTEE